MKKLIVFLSAIFSFTYLESAQMSENEMFTQIEESILHNSIEDYKAQAIKLLNAELEKNMRLSGGSIKNLENNKNDEQFCIIKSFLKQAVLFINNNKFQNSYNLLQELSRTFENLDLKEIKSKLNYIIKLLSNCLSKYIIHNDAEFPPDISGIISEYTDLYTSIKSNHRIVSGITSFNGLKFAALVDSHDLTIWDTKTKKLLRSIDIPINSRSERTLIGLLSDNSKIIYYYVNQSSNTGVVLYDINDGTWEVLISRNTTTLKKSNITFSPNFKFLYSIYGRDFTIINIDSRKKLTLQMPADIKNFKCSYNGFILYFYHNDNVIRKIDIRNFDAEFIEIYEYGFNKI